MSPLLVALWFVAGDMPPPDAPPPKAEILEESKFEAAFCRPDLGQCAVEIDKLVEYIRKRDEIARRLAALEKSCTAKIDVPPSQKKPPAGYKKERELKWIPSPSS